MHLAHASADEARLRKLSATLEAARKDGEDWIISVGGANLTPGRATLPPDKIGDITAFRLRYESLTRDTLSVGVGLNIEDADRALEVALRRGGDQAVFWRDELAEELEEGEEDDLLGKISGDDIGVYKKVLKSASDRSAVVGVLVDLQKNAHLLRSASPRVVKAVESFLDVASEYLATTPAEEPTQPLEKSDTPPCTCGAYTFPHRRSSGSCKEKPLEKMDLVPGNKGRRNLYHMPVQHDKEIGYPTGTQLSPKGRVKIMHSDLEMGPGVMNPDDTSWVQMRDGMIMSRDGHPISSRNPNGK